MSNAVIPKENQTAWQRWELASLGPAAARIPAAGTQAKSAAKLPTAEDIELALDAAHGAAAKWAATAPAARANVLLQIADRKRRDWTKPQGSNDRVGMQYGMQAFSSDEASVAFSAFCEGQGTDAGYTEKRYCRTWLRECFAALEEVSGSLQ